MRGLAWIVGFGVAAASVGALAGPGSSVVESARPDRSFGQGRGWIVMRLPGSVSVAYGVAVLGDGDIVVAGQAGPRTPPPSGGGQVLVVRYLPNGRIDRGFAARGIFETKLPAGAGPYLATSIVSVGRDGKLMVAGGFGEGSILVLRLTAAGRLDRSFGRFHDGMAVVPAGGIADSLAVEPDGEILVGSSDANLPGRPMVVARLTPDGRLDGRFGRGGIARVLFWNRTAASSAGTSGLFVTRDGEIVASGHLDYIGGSGGASGGHGSAGIFRLSSHGRLTRSFGSEGHVQVAFREPRRSFATWFPCAMTVDSQGRITIAGGGTVPTDRNRGRGALLSARLTPIGLPDRSYGSGGRAVTLGLPENTFPTCGAALTRGMHLTTGVGSDVVQLLPNGAPNESFALRGILTTRPRKATINALTAYRPGRIVVVGATAQNDLYLARYRLPPT